jgi:hypothetical membrane protein
LRTLVTAGLRVGAVLWIASAVGYVVVEGVAAAAIPGYDYARDYISDLGRPEVSPHAALMNAAFVVQTVAFPLGAFLVTRARKALPFRVLALVNGVGNLLVAVVHSGAGAPAHAVGAVLAVVGGNAAILAWAVRERSWPSAALGVLGLGAFALFALGVHPVGAWERVSVYAIYLWQAAAGALLIAHRACAD